MAMFRIGPKTEGAYKAKAVATYLFRETVWGAAYVTDIENQKVYMSGASSSQDCPNLQVDVYRTQGYNLWVKFPQGGYYSWVKLSSIFYVDLATGQCYATAGLDPSSYYVHLAQDTTKDWIAMLADPTGQGGAIIYWGTTNPFA